MSIAAPPRLLTIEEFITLHENDRVELVRGVVVDKGMPTPLHGLVCLNMAGHIFMYLHSNDIGKAMTNDSFMRTNQAEKTVRGPDIMYYSYQRLPKGTLLPKIMETPADLVVEVKSPTDRLSALNHKATEYIEAGVRVAIILDPDKAAATIFRENELPQTLHNGDMLTVPEVLPGFEVMLAKLFT